MMNPSLSLVIRWVGGLESWSPTSATNKQSQLAFVSGLYWFFPRSDLDIAGFNPYTKALKRKENTDAVKKAYF